MNGFPHFFSPFLSPWHSGRLKKEDGRGKRKRPRDDGTTAFGLDDGRNDKRKEGDFLLLSEADVQAEGDRPSFL